MKYGFLADNNHLDANIADRMSCADWLVVVDPDTLSIEAEPALHSSGGPGAGIKAAARLIDMGPRF